MKQLMAGGGIILLGTTLIPLLSGLFSGSGLWIFSPTGLQTGSKSC